MEREQVTFIKDNLRLMLKAKSVDEIVGMVHVLLNYTEMIAPEAIELWFTNVNNFTNRIEAIKTLRLHLNCGLKEAKDMTENSSTPFYRGHDARLAMSLHKDLTRYTTVDIRGANPAMQVLFGGK